MTDVEVLNAAAPKMLEALKRCVDPCMGIAVHQDQLGDKCICYDCTTTLVKTAIAEATGEGV